MEDLTNSLVLNVGDGITGISRGIEKANTLIVTCEKEGIKIYEVFDQKCIKNWTTPPSLKFKGSCVQDIKSRCFFACTESSTIASWRHNELDILSRSEKKFDEEVFQLHCGKIKRKKWSTVAVMKNESIILLDHEMNVIHVYPGDSSRTVVWSDHLTIDGDDYVITIFRSNDDNTYSFHVFTLYNEPSIRERSIFELSVSSSKEFKAACFQQESSPFLSVYWDDGNCEVWQFESISHLTSNEKTPLHKVHSSLPFSTKSISMFPISTFVFGVAGETKDGKVCMCTINALWGTLLEKTILPKLKDKNIQSSVLLQDCQSVALSFSKEICICKLKNNRGTLFEAIGTMENPTLYPGAPKDGEFARRELPLCVDGSLSLGVYLQPHSFSNQNNTNYLSVQYFSNLKRDNEYEYHVVEALTNKKYTPTEKEFMDIFNPYVEYCTKYNIGGERFQPYSKRKTKAWDHWFEFDTSKTVKLSEYFVLNVSERCLNDKFWDALLFLLTTGLLSYSLLKEKLISTLMENNQIKLLHACLCKLRDLDDRCLSKLLTYFMDNKDSKFINDYLASLLETSDGVDGFEFVNIIFSLPINEAFTTQSIYELDTSYVIPLLEYLLKYLRVYSGNHTEKLEVKSICVPRYKNIIKWTTMAIDAHATNLLLTDKKAVDLLVNIKKELSIQIDICDNVRNMKGSLFHVLRKRPMPQTSQQNYSIELFYA